MVDDAVHTLDHELSDRVEAPARFAPGTTIGHFRVVRMLGEGGMGVVFEAHDPDLDRRVAIKVVRDRGAGSAAGARLIREAQAMARLAHPNVVAVYEVGTIDDQVFVVMELVPGTTLAEWLARPRTWREIIEVFLAAAQGLVAAHHAGLVHRDFKPTNVLVDHHDRVRVSDFGLAHLDEQAKGSEPVIAGTLAYMAPEQRAGKAVDARADQYSFAIALQDAARTVKVPRRIRTAIVRALSIDPASRFPSLDELAAELRRSLHSRRRALAIGLGATAALGVAAFALIEPIRSAEVSCADGADLVDRMWNPAARAVQLTHFLAANPNAQVEVASTNALVDEWAASWKLGRRAACTLDEPQRTARLGCLDRGLHELHAQLTLWRSADAAITREALHAAASLPEIDECAGQEPQHPIDLRILDKISEMNALVRSGHGVQAHAAAPGLLVLARTTGSPRDLAAGYVAAGHAADEAGFPKEARETFERAAQEAGRAGDDALLLDALIGEASATSNLSRPLESLGLLDAAHAIDQRAGGYANHEIELIRGMALFDAGRPKDAEAVMRAILPDAEKNALRDPKARLRLSTLLSQLGAAISAQDRYEPARELLARCVALDELNYGPEHPELAKSLTDLASIDAHLERFALSAQEMDRAEKIFRTAYGDHGLLLGKLALERANLLGLQQKYLESNASLEVARTAFTGLLPSDHLFFATIEQGLASDYRNLDRCKDALPHVEAALRLFEGATGNRRSHALELTEYGACLAYTDRIDEASVALDRSIGEIQELHLARRWEVEPRGILAELEWDAHHRDKAIELMRGALAAAADDHTDELARLTTGLKEDLATWTRTK